MSPSELISGLSAFEQRGAGTDSERRAGLWLADRIADSGREVIVETFWCRPNWALAQMWHGIAALAGSLIAVHNPRVGGLIVLVALISTASDAVFGFSLGRRLTPERASQNIIALPPRGTRRRPVSLILTAPYDDARAGFVARDGIRRSLAEVRSWMRGAAPGWIFWFALAQLWLVAISIARFEGSAGSGIGVLQLLPTIAVVLSTSALLDLATAEISPAAGESASGVAAALAITAALDAAPPAQAAVHLVLTGAGQGAGIGLRQYLSTRKRSLRVSNAVVVGIGPCAHGTPRYWVSDGQFVPVRHFSTLITLCRTAAGRDPELGLAPYRGRGASPALAARLAGLPAVTIGSLDSLGRPSPADPPTPTVAPAKADPAAIALTVEVGLLLTEEIDGYLAAQPAPAASESPSAAARPRPRTRRPPARKLF